MSGGVGVGEMMWRSVDYLARLWTGKSTAQDTALSGLPLWLITKANQPSGNPSTGYYPYVVNYPAEYEKLWGLKGRGQTVPRCCPTRLGPPSLPPSTVPPPSVPCRLTPASVTP